MIRKGLCFGAWGLNYFGVCFSLLDFTCGNVFSIECSIVFASWFFSFKYVLRRQCLFCTCRQFDLKLNCVFVCGLIRGVSAAITCQCTRTCVVYKPTVYFRASKLTRRKCSKEVKLLQVDLSWCIYIHLYGLRSRYGH